MVETDLEKIESVDMMRIIENDEKVHMVMTNEYSFSVDTQADLHNVERKMENDQLMKTYME